MPSTAPGAEWVGKILPNHTAGVIGRELKTIKSGLTLDTLKNLKATGATLGAVNAKEFEALETAVRNLQQSQGDESLRSALLDVRARIVPVMARIDAARAARQGGDVFSAADAIIGG